MTECQDSALAQIAASEELDAIGGTTVANDADVLRQRKAKRVR